MHYQLTYELVDDYLSRREPFRAQHLALAQAATERGELVLAGALSDPADQAVLVFEGIRRRRPSRSRAPIRTCRTAS